MSDYDEIVKTWWDNPSYFWYVGVRDCTDERLKVYLEHCKEKPEQVWKQHAKRFQDELNRRKKAEEKRQKTAKKWGIKL